MSLLKFVVVREQSLTTHVALSASGRGSCVVEHGSLSMAGNWHDDLSEMLDTVVGLRR